MIKDYYIFRLKNGTVSLSLFDYKNPIPYLNVKGPISSKKTIESLRDAINKTSNKEIKEIIKPFIKHGNDFSDKIKQGFEDGKKRI